MHKKIDANRARKKILNSVPNLQQTAEGISTPEVVLPQFDVTQKT